MKTQGKNKGYVIRQSGPKLKNAIKSWKSEMEDYVMTNNPGMAFKGCEREALSLIDICMNEGMSELAWQIDKRFARFKAIHIFGEAYRQASKLDLDLPSFMGGNGREGCYTGSKLIEEVFKQIETKVDEAKSIIKEYGFNKDSFGKAEERVYYQFNKTKAQMSNGR